MEGLTITRTPATRKLTWYDPDTGDDTVREIPREAINVSVDDLPDSSATLSVEPYVRWNPLGTPEVSDQMMVSITHWRNGETVRDERERQPRGFVGQVMSVIRDLANESKARILTIWQPNHNSQRVLNHYVTKGWLKPLPHHHRNDTSVSASYYDGFTMTDAFLHATLDQLNEDKLLVADREEDPTVGPNTGVPQSAFGVFDKHYRLHSTFWDGELHLLPMWRKPLLRLAKAYKEFLGLPAGTVCVDVTLTGSLCGYNYTKHSDLDVHLIVRYSSLEMDADLAAEFFAAKRDLWAEQNKIKVGGYPVELYAQDAEQYNTGHAPQYSLLLNKWVKKPKKPPVNLHINDVRDRARKLIRAIRVLEVHGIKDPEKALEQIKELRDTIKTLRKDAIKKGGDYAPGNLVFKVLRNGGYMERIWELEHQCLTAAVKTAGLKGGI